MASLLDWISNPLGSAISTIGGFYSNAQNAKENQKNREWNEKMWKLNNEYNSPSAVLQRYADAGIGVNPNYLVTGSYNGGLSSYAGNLDASRSLENPAKNTNLGFLEAQNIKNQTELKDSQIETNASQQRKNDADANKANEEAKVQQKIAEYKTTENKYQESNIILDLAHKGLENSVLELTRDYTKDANPLQISILRENVEKAKADKKISENTANLILKQIDTEIERKNLVIQEQKTEGTKQALNIASAANQYAQSAASYASARSSLSQAGYYDAQKLETITLLPNKQKQLDEATKKLVSETNLNYEQANKLIIDGYCAFQQNDRENYRDWVVNGYGDNIASTVTNILGNVITGDNPQKQWQQYKALDKNVKLWFKPNFKPSKKR